MLKNLVFIYMTAQSKQEAIKIAKHLLEKKLVACANIFDKMTSLYHWEGKLAEAQEAVLIAKTTDEKFAAVKKEIETIHSYTVPCIVKIPVLANEKFAKWVEEEVR